MDYPYAVKYDAEVTGVYFIASFRTLDEARSAVHLLAETSCYSKLCLIIYDQELHRTVYQYSIHKGEFEELR